ncbi:MAG: VOC family protein [Anaerolineales bacterium]|nr:VOC family protein [Anaerolineales bacterium]
MTILGVHHVQITVAKNEEAAARAFYLGVLGLPEVEKPTSLKDRGGFWLQVGDRAVHVGLEDGVDRWQTKGHIAYQVDDLAHWRSVMTAAGLTVLESIPIPGYERFEFRDPFGNRVEMIMELANK